MEKQLIYILLLVTCAVRAQESSTLWCHELNISEGLTSQDYNFYVTKDSEDYVWVSSIRGLNRFDGKNVKTYRADFSDSTQLYGENIQSKMYEDINKNLWFCTYEAVHCYNREKDEFRHFFLRDSKGELIKEDYKVFHIENGKQLWLRTGGRNGNYDIHRVDISGEIPDFEQSKPIMETKYYHVFPGLDANGQMRYLFSTSGKKQNGIDYFEAENDDFVLKERKTEEDKTWNFPVFQCHFEAPNSLWMSTDAGLKKWNVATKELTSFPFEVQDFIFFERLGEEHFIVSAYNKGIFLFNKNTGKYIPYYLRSISATGNELDTKCRNIYIDDDQVLWVSRMMEGLAYVSFGKRKFDFINNTHTDASTVRYKGLFDLKDSTFLSVYHDGWMRMNGNGKFIANSQFRRIPGVLSAAVNRGEELIFGTRKGAYVSDLKTKKIEKITGSDKFDFLDLCILEEDKILALVMRKGIKLLTRTKGVWQMDSLSTDGSSSSYSHVFQGSSGDVFVCDNNSRILVFNFEGERLVHKDTLPIPGDVYDYYEDEKRNLLWIATSYGLVKVSTKKLQIVGRPYLEKDGLADNTIHAIQPDGQNRLWISTLRGLSLFDPKTEKGKSYSLADGVGSEYFWEGASVKHADGTIWFDGRNGISVIPSESAPLLEKQPTILITDFRIDGDLPKGGVRCARTGSTNINQVEKLEYDHLSNSLSFEFVATDYSDPENAQLNYKLEKVGGPLEKWKQNKVGERAVARYQHLPHGEYQLSIEALNSDANPNFVSRKVIEITILPQIWERPWFWPLVIAMSLLLVFGYYQWRLKEVRQTEELKTKNAINKMQALLGQMNPHFIFNSLQSINRFILKGEKRQASEYLGRFSGLIRMMLENSRDTKHLVETEVEFLMLYMKVEAQRFKHTFGYEINVDEEIDPSIIEIPSMMLQPFVENAIWHGISHRMEGGYIKINLDLKGEILQCSIEDNGVGMKAAAKIAEARGKTHKSRAMSIVKDRLKLLFPKQQEMCDVKHKDIIDGNGLVCGTRAVVRLPI